MEEKSTDIPQELVSILGCPACKQRPPVSCEGDTSYLMCKQCGRSYPIEDGIPIMLPEKAEMPGKSVTE